MAISQTEVNEAVLSTASKRSELAATYDALSNVPAAPPSTAVDGVPVGVCRYVTIQAKVATNTKTAYVEVFGLDPAGASWYLITSFWATQLNVAHRIYVGTATRVAVRAPDDRRLPAFSSPNNLTVQILRELPASPV
jgi:hypothetical protein